MLQAATERDRGDIRDAIASAEIATVSAPWSAGAALMLESLRHLGGQSPILTSERLAELAERFPTNAMPYLRAAQVLEGQALVSTPAQQESLWPLVAELRRLAAQRDPRNVLNLHALALAQLAMKRADQASVTNLRSLHIEPNFARGLVLKAYLEVLQSPGSLSSVAKNAMAQARDVEKYIRQFSSPYPKQVLSLDDRSLKMLTQMESKN